MSSVTVAERDELRLLVDRATREKVGPICKLCGAPFTRTRPNRLFCSEGHRKMFWDRHTEAGRINKRDRKRRTRARHKAMSATKGS